jgi:hypothetical protein
LIVKDASYGAVILEEAPASLNWPPAYKNSSAIELPAICAWNFTGLTLG